MSQSTTANSNVPMKRIISVTLLQRRSFVQLFTQPPLKATLTGKILFTLSNIVLEMVSVKNFSISYIAIFVFIQQIIKFVFIIY